MIKRILLVIGIVIGTNILFATMFGIHYYAQLKYQARQVAKAAQAERLVKIGVILPLTGNGAEAGIAAQKALNLTLKELEQKNLKYDYQLIYEDNQASPRLTVSATNKLIQKDKVFAILSIWNHLSVVAANIADKNNTLSLSCAYGKDPAARKYNFNTIANTDDMTSLMAQELSKRDIKSIALFSNNTDGHTLINESLQKELKKYDIEVVFNAFFHLDEKDYRMPIIEASQKNPDIYFLSGLPPSSVIFMKQIKEILGDNVKVTSIDAFSAINNDQRAIAEGLWYVDSNITGNDTFRQKMQSQAGLEIQSCTGNTVANLQILIQAIESSAPYGKKRTPNNESVTDWINRNVLDFNTASGPATASEDGLIQITPEVKIIKNGKPTVIKEP
ncbi:MAG: ABC transporter substrate-binding protein [Lactobacillus sp.]|jgi:ABC-type branched-subunit amino acid transport system substrate-binding protein|nr:ABC transporter substrate-binding protein [Lactobacillus sp.]